MKKDFLSLIKTKVVLFDGGMGTMLMHRGLAEWEVPESWNIARPEDLRDVHRAYIEAGAEVVQTNTFGANRIKLKSSDAGRALDLEKVNVAAVEAVREAVESSGRDDVFIAGDIGPTGQFFPPVGTLSPQKAREAFREQAGFLDSAGVDLFLIETMFDVNEAIEALRGVREVSDRPVVVELTFELKPRGYFTMMGTTPEEGLEMLAGEGADVLGSNCTITSSDMIELARVMREATDKPLLFQPNAGKPEMEGGRAVYRQKPEEFALDMMEIVRIGANAVGGCCGTSPDFIRALHEHLVAGR